MTKYIFVTGGVVSSIGKGIVAASLGRLLKNRGLNVIRFWENNFSKDEVFLKIQSLEIRKNGTRI